MDLFQQAMSFIWRPENDGQPLHFSPHDPGGATSWGMTFQTWAAWRGMHGQVKSMDIFKGWPKESFAPIYRTMFWNSCRCTDIGIIGVAVFDAAVLSGPGNAAKLLQHALGVAADGAIGPVTIGATKSIDAARLNDLYLAERNAFYQASPNAAYFAHGWMRRADDCHKFVAALLADAAQQGAAP